MFQLSYLLKDAINRRDISSEVGGLKKSSFGQARVHIFVFLILFVVMLTGIHHPYLWVPDEPREAEIARETLVDGHWVTPHLCGLPFLEKPPLFYDIIAAAYALTGSISPSVARVIPVVFGMIMLAAVFWFCNRWAGPRTAWLSVLVLLTMPKFYGYSHLILLDIAVGTFCTVAIVAFAFWLWWADSDVKKQALLCLFYLASAGAFMTKGFAGLFHIVVIVGVFVLITRRWQPLCKLICAWPIFVFIIPVGIWVYLFYREGGIPYLHEHFVNNVIGRFLKVHFVLPNARFYNTDLGKGGTWLFYIKNLPVTIGPVLALLPFAIWKAASAAVRSVRESRHGRNVQGDIWLLLLIWAVVPVFVLSLSAAMETSYIIPSYAAMAILAGAWLDERFPKAEGQKWQGIGWLSVAAVIAVLSILLSAINANTYVIVTLGFVALTIPALLILLYRKKFIQICFLLIAVMMSLVMIELSPNVQHDFRRSRCALPLANDVWKRVGAASLYLYKPKDILRGSIAFYGKRTVPELDMPEQLRVVLTSGQKVFILADVRKLEAVYTDASFANLYTIQQLPDFGLNAKYVLLTAPP